MSTISAGKPAISSANHHGRAHFCTQWLSPATAVVSVHGELDASNGAELTECGILHSRPSRQLVLDLSAVEFFGTGCFACLHTLNVRCAGENIDGVMSPSSAVSRVLGICDPAGALPTSSGLPAALSMLRNHPLPFQLVNVSR